MVMTDDELQYWEEKGVKDWAEAEVEPKLLFKYKSVAQTLDFDRLCEGLKNNWLFFPTIAQLNDSLEGRGTRILCSDTEVYETPVADKYRVLSLSATCFSPVMWSHYADNRKGVALGFYKGNSQDPGNAWQHWQ